MKQVNVLLVDDNKEFLAGAANYLSKDPLFSVAGTLSSGYEAVKVVEQKRPDLVLMDIAMPGVNGLDTARMIRKNDKLTKIVMLTLYDIEEYRSKSKEAGADGFIPKSDFVFRFPSLVNELFPELGIQNAADTKRHDHKTHRNTDDSDIQNIQQNALKKLNCWEFKKCGRGPGSNDVCPAAIDTRLNGVHGGRNSGRACWVVAGTYCGGKVQGTFAKKFDTCEKCEFYCSVKSDERESFQLSAVLLSKVR